MKTPHVRLCCINLTLLKPRGDLPSLGVWIINLDVESVVCFSGNIDDKRGNIGPVGQAWCMGGREGGRRQWYGEEGDGSTVDLTWA